MLLTGLFTSATVQSMFDWVQRKIPSMFQWRSSRTGDTLHGNGLNGRSKNSKGIEQTATHHRYIMLYVNFDTSAVRLNKK